MKFESTLGLAMIAWMTFSGDATANQVLIVDSASGPGSDFALLQDAVDAASDGDIVLVRGGTYAAVRITAKSLTLGGIPDLLGVRPRLDGIQVDNIAANQKVILRGLNVRHLASNSFSALSVFACAGPVFAEECDFVNETILIPAGGAGVGVSTTESFTMSRCTAEGFHGQQPFGPFDQPEAGSVAVGALSSKVNLYDCKLRGGAGANAASTLFGLFVDAVPAGDAVRVTNTQLFLAGCELIGGKGGNGAFVAGTGCLDSASGGDGVEATDSVVTYFDNVITPGIKGFEGAGCTSPSLSGEPFHLINSTANQLPEMLRSLEVTSPVSPGGTVTTTVLGNPGENTLLLVSLVPNGAYFAAVKGALVGGAPLQVVPLGAMPATGQIAFDLLLPNPLLPAGIEGIEVYEQVFVGGSSGFGLLSSPSILVISDQL